VGSYNKWSNSGNLFNIISKNMISQNPTQHHISGDLGDPNSSHGNYTEG